MFETLFQRPEFCQVGILHQLGMHDFTTFSVSLSTRAYLPLVLQVGSEFELADFRAPGTGDAAKRAIVHACIKRAVDVPVFLTLPASITEINTFSPVILAVDDAVLGVALSMCSSCSSSSYPDFPLIHPALPMEEQAYFIKVMVMCALESPITWLESLTMPRKLDMAFGVDAHARELLGTQADKILAYFYPALEESQGASGQECVKMSSFEDV